MQLEIITPEKKLYEGEVKAVTVPGTDGSLGILNNHAPLISSLKNGTVRATDMQQVEHSFKIKGGVVEVNHNKVIVLAE